MFMNFNSDELRIFLFKNKEQLIRKDIPYVAIEILLNETETQGQYEIRVLANIPQMPIDKINMNLESFITQNDLKMDFD